MMCSCTAKCVAKKVLLRKLLRPLGQRLVRPVTSEAGIVTWQVTGLAQIDNSLCTRLYRAKLSCLDQRTFFNSAVQWGSTIGSRRVFNELYPRLIGASLSVLFSLLHLVCAANC